MKYFIIIYLLILLHSTSQSQSYTLCNKYRQVEIGSYHIKDTLNKKLYLEGNLNINKASKEVAINFNTKMYIYHFTYCNYSFKGRIILENNNQLKIKIDSLKYNSAIGSGFSKGNAENKNFIAISPMILDVKFISKRKVIISNQIKFIKKNSI